MIKKIGVYSLAGIISLSGIMLMDTDLVHAASKNIIGSKITSRAAISINSTNVKIYTVMDGTEDVMTVPSNLQKSFQLKVSGAKNVTYSCNPREGGAQVDQNGLITVSDWYFPGTTVTNNITVNADGKTFIVKVTVTDYATEYAGKILDDIVKKNITSNMTTYQKLETIAKYVAENYDYDADISNPTSELIRGKGNCVANAGIVNGLCERAGIKSMSRRANKDPGTYNSMHVNNFIVTDDGKYYYIDCGEFGEKPRGYSFFELTSPAYIKDLDTDNMTASVYQYDSMDDVTSIDIPSNVDGYKIVAISSDFAYVNDMIKKVTIPDTVKSIGDRAFMSYFNLEEFHIPASVTHIGTRAFANTKLKEGLTCDKNNKSFTVKDGVLYTKNMTSLVAAPRVKNVTIPQSVQKIESYAFDYGSINSLTIPSSVTELEKHAIEGASSLKSVKIEGNSLKELPEGAFHGCTSLKKILIPDSVTVFGEDLFYQANTPAPEDFTIYANKGSAAEAYAKKHNYSFKQASEFDDDEKTQDSSGVNIGADKISAPQTYKLSATQYIYDGKVKSPNIKIYDKKGKKYQHQIIKL